MNAFSDIDALLRVISREKDILRFLFVNRKAPSLRREQAGIWHIHLPITLKLNLIALTAA